MTQEQKRIKLAEAEGRKWYVHLVEGAESAHPGHRFLAFPGEWMAFIRVREADMSEPIADIFDRLRLPDYFNDLNAVHELWASLPRGTRLMVVHHLAKMIKLPKGNQNETGELEEALFSASAAQRAEAIGKTLNLW